MAVKMIPDPGQTKFVNSYWGTIAIVDFLVFLVAYSTATAVGFSRLSCVPIVIAVAGFWASVGAYLSAEDHVTSRAGLYSVRLVAHLGWHIQETIAVFYSYFLLERILQHDLSATGRFFKRRSYLSVFWLLTILNISFRIAIVAMYIAWWGIYFPGAPSDSRHPMIHCIEIVSQSFFLLTALTEVWNAIFLVKVFKTAVRTSQMYCGGLKVGLFKQMVLSTEVRVASLAIVGITRAGISLNKNFNTYLYALDMIMWTLNHMYAVVLIADLLMTRMSSARFIVVDRTSGDVVERKCSCGGLPEDKLVFMGGSLSTARSKGSEATTAIEETEGMTICIGQPIPRKPLDGDEESLKIATSTTIVRVESKRD